MPPSTWQSVVARLLVTVFCAAITTAAGRAGGAERPFFVRVVDEQTGRGVPLVELRTVNEVRYYTDSAGVAAIDEASGKRFFFVSSPGYEFPADGFGFRGRTVEVAPGRSAEWKIRRVQAAERLYRVTGEGIYRDSLRAGLRVPIRRPILNAGVLGSDSVVNALFRGRLHWFWGDTNRAEYPLGNFYVPGAVSRLPADGGLDPAVGVNLEYFTADDGFAKETARLAGPGPCWLSGLFVLRDDAGKERLFAGYRRIRGQLETYERGLVEFDPASSTWKPRAVFPLDMPAGPDGHTFLRREGSREWVYFCTPFPFTRVPADAAATADPARYEAYTCLAPGARPRGNGPRDGKPERDVDGRLRLGWKANTPPLSPQEEAEWVRDGRLRPEEALCCIGDTPPGAPVIAHAGTVHWNAYRRRWIALFNQIGGTSFLGEVWYAEADSPQGPWRSGRKVATHPDYSFYNPRHHPYFDQQGGRIIFFEGTYSVTFSGNRHPAPRYDYNQLMYRLDLAAEGLKLPPPASGSTP